MKDRRYHTYPSRWRPEGTVHRYVYSRENRVWYVFCYEPFSDPHGRRVDDNAEITCKRCLRKLNAGR